VVVLLELPPPPHPVSRIAEHSAIARPLPICVEIACRKMCFMELSPLVSRRTHSFPYGIVQAYRWFNVSIAIAAFCLRDCHGKEGGAMWTPPFSL
jgi:hypothetical protein